MEMAWCGLVLKVKIVKWLFGCYNMSSYDYDSPPMAKPLWNTFNCRRAYYQQQVKKCSRDIDLILLVAQVNWFAHYTAFDYLL